MWEEKQARNIQLYCTLPERNGQDRVKFVSIDVIRFTHDKSLPLQTPSLRSLGFQARLSFKVVQTGEETANHPLFNSFRTFLNTFALSLFFARRVLHRYDVFVILQL